MTGMPFEPTGCYCQTQALNCDQGRWCPLRADTEASNVIPLRSEFPAPKGKQRMSYRLSSSALTGRAARTMSEAFGCHPSDPVHPMPDADSPALLNIFGRAVAVFGRLLARLFCR